MTLKNGKHNNTHAINKHDSGTNDDNSGSIDDGD